MALCGHEDRRREMFHLGKVATLHPEWKHSLSSKHAFKPERGAIQRCISVAKFLKVIFVFSLPFCIPSFPQDVCFDRVIIKREKQCLLRCVCFRCGTGCRRLAGAAILAHFSLF